MFPQAAISVSVLNLSNKVLVNADGLSDASTNDKFVRVFP